MCIMFIITIVIIAIIAIIVIKIILLKSTHKSGILGWILGLTGGKHSYIQGPGIAAKIL
jgi:hypothetical protein